ncbi:lysine-specific demethylase 7B-like isoform X1 [Cyprinus carpio]|uniref:Lysine-specific demethylase 7B-like isoform X1 n=1 Tax=Cyprinus carpio TaxID=7962 RepID=A0A9Q9XW97_CYPCA|nr:lysine-specific demethylase 7B-like isoform X1 [Cyprinus carpio]
MATAQLYCVCRQPYDVSRFMIECDICKDWFHGRFHVALLPATNGIKPSSRSPGAGCYLAPCTAWFGRQELLGCVEVEEHHAVDIDVYHCPNCDAHHGPSLMKKRRNWHRHDYTEPDDGSKPVQAGTSVFVRELQARTFPSGDEILQQMHGSQVTQRYLERHGFRYPIAVHKMEELGLRLPPPDFSVKDVERYVGGDKVIDVIDVARQADSKMKLSAFVKYYYSPQRPKVLNVISLEFSDTKMSELVVVPDIAQKMSWVENYWPDDSYFPKPFVQKYCLMGVKDSYTDFHIDFGGTSVWYHVLWGEKVFYLIKPTPANLALYEEWSSSPNQSEVFFGEKVDKCYKCVVRQGTTLLIPTGWIHAVLTSQDCMAFGGNFLHNLNIGMQLRCYEMERRLKTPDLFKFPYFEAICWYVAKNLLETLKESREDNCLPPEYLIKGVKALITALRNWLKREVTEPASEVPDHIRPSHLIKMLTKEIQYLEDYQNGNCGSKLMKSQGISACPSTRSAHERRSHARRTARRLRDQDHHHSHSPKAPSNLDIFEQHTQEVLKRLEMGPNEEDASFNLKFNKVSTASAAVAERSLDNNLRLLLCNGRIIRDNRQHVGEKRPRIKEDEGSRDVKMDSFKIKLVPKEEEQEVDIQIKEEDKQHYVARDIKPFADFNKQESSDLRNRESVLSDISSDSESDAEYSIREKNCSEGESESSSEEEEDEKIRRSGDDQSKTKSCTGYTTDEHPSRQNLDPFEKRLKSESATSPSTEEDAIQGMLSMAGLLYSHPSEDPSSSQESWWSRTNRPSPDYSRKEVASGEENQDSDSNSSQESFRERDSEGEHHAKLKHRIQEHKNFMDSQGSGSNSSSEAWSSHTHSPAHGESPTLGYQYCETSLSPPLHPSKRPALNPPPISNQATKGKRPKKGMATAKQRLGKILKLSRHKPFFV